MKIVVLLVVPTLVLAWNTGVAEAQQRFSANAGAQYGAISTAEGPIGGPGFATEFLLQLTSKVSLYAEIGKQDLGKLELFGTNMVFDDYGVGVFEGTQENAYDMTYQTFGVVYTNHRDEASTWWGGIGIGVYTFNTEVTVKEGWFRYADVWGNYDEVNVAGYSDAESLSLTGVAFTGGASTVLDGWFRLYMKVTTHVLPIGDDLQYTTSLDGTIAVLSLTVGAGIGF